MKWQICGDKLLRQTVTDKLFFLPLLRWVQLLFVLLATESRTEGKHNPPKTKSNNVVVFSWSTWQPIRNKPHGTMSCLYSSGYLHTVFVAPAIPDVYIFCIVCLISKHLLHIYSKDKNNPMKGVSKLHNCGTQREELFPKDSGTVEGRCPYLWWNQVLDKHLKTTKQSRTVCLYAKRHSQTQGSAPDLLIQLVHSGLSDSDNPQEPFQLYNCTYI